MKEGWKYCKLGEVCNIIGGGTPNKKEPTYYGGDILWATVGDMNVETLSTTELSITDKAVKESSTHIIPSGEIIIATRVGLGKVCLLKNDTAINQDLKGIIPNGKYEINRRFLFYYFKEKADYIVSNGVGATVQGVKLNFISELMFPLPSLSDQQSIVAYLDTSFSLIDSLAENAKKALENAKALFQAKLKELMEKKDGWEEKKIEEVSENLDYRRKPITKGNRESGVYPYYGASGIVDYVKDYIYDEDILLVSEDGANLLARSTPIAFSVTGKVWVNNHAHVLKFDNFYTQRFVEYFFASIDISPYVTGAAQPKFNQARLNSLVVPMPPLSEQEQIVQTLDSLSEKIQQLQQNYNQTLANCQALKQALLKETFE